MNTEDLLQAGRAVIASEVQAVADLAARIDETFAKACKLVLECQGRVVVTGVGKSGHIGGKIAATLASTGTPAFFVHAGEASHGDLGMIQKGDVAVFISNSGETSELLLMMPLLKRHAVPIISMTGNPNSSLAKAADANLDISVEREACPLGLAPTASTTATLAMGDALAVTLLQSKGFTPEDFALSHPGGSLGKRLLLRVEDVMLTGKDIPNVSKDILASDAIVEISKKGLGFTTVTDAQGELLGVFTDGDIRRCFDAKVDLLHTTIGEIMTPCGRTASPHQLAAEAMQLMEKYAITALPVLDDNKQLCGALNMHTLFRAGVV